jgi:hypothetical protein
MNISDIRTKIDAQNERSRLVTRGAELSTKPDETVLTLVDHAERNEPESSIRHFLASPLINAHGIPDLIPASTDGSFLKNSFFLAKLFDARNCTFSANSGMPTKLTVSSLRPRTISSVRSEFT